METTPTLEGVYGLINELMKDDDLQKLQAEDSVKAVQQGLQKLTDSLILLDSQAEAFDDQFSGFESDVWPELSKHAVRLPETYRKIDRLCDMVQQLEEVMAAVEQRMDEVDGKRKSSNIMGGMMRGFQNLNRPGPKSQETQKALGGSALPHFNAADYFEPSDKVPREEDDGT
eukprot:Clim_evm30s88 gene=Clim_evmTU30s88